MPSPILHHIQPLSRLSIPALQTPRISLFAYFALNQVYLPVVESFRGALICVRNAMGEKASYAEFLLIGVLYLLLSVIRLVILVFETFMKLLGNGHLLHTRFIIRDALMNMNWGVWSLEWHAKRRITAAVQSGSTNDALQIILIMTPNAVEMRSKEDAFARAAYTIPLEMTPPEGLHYHLAYSPRQLLECTTEPIQVPLLNHMMVPEFRWLMAYSLAADDTTASSTTSATASPSYLFLSNQYSIEVFSLITGKKSCTWHHHEIFSLPQHNTHSKIFIMQMQYVHNHLIMLLNDMRLYVLDVQRMMQKVQSLKPSKGAADQKHLFSLSEVLDNARLPVSSTKRPADLITAFEVDVEARTIFFVSVPVHEADDEPTLPTLHAYKFPATWFNKTIIPSLLDDFTPMVSTPSSQFNSKRPQDAIQRITYNDTYLAHQSAHNNILNIYDKSTLHHISTFPFLDITSLEWYSHEEIILSRRDAHNLSIYNIFTHEERLEAPERLDGVSKVSQSNAEGQFFILEQLMGAPEGGDDDITGSSSRSDDSATSTHRSLPQKIAHFVHTFLIDYFTQTATDALSEPRSKSATNSPFIVDSSLPEQFSLRYNVMSFQKEAPLSYFEHYLESEQFEEALQLAQEYSLDKDAVLKRQWENALKSSTAVDALRIVADWHISSILEQVQDKRWALAQCLGVLGDSDMSMRHLLDLSIDLNTEILAEALGMDASRDDLQQELQHHFQSKDTLSEDESMLIHIRQHILRSADRMQTLLKYMKHYNWREFHAFSCCNLMEYARENARRCRVDFLKYLFVYHADEVSETQKLELLSEIPLQTSAKVFGHLLPALKDAQVLWEQNPRAWRTQRDFVENIKRFARSQQDASPLTPKVVADWYMDRVTALDEAMQHENALLLTEIGLKKGVTSLQVIHDELRMLCLVAMDNANMERIRLRDIREMRGEQLLSQVLESATEDNVLHRFQTVVLPYIAQRKKQQDSTNKVNYLLRYLLIDYLAIYRDETRLTERVVQQSVEALCGTSDEEPIVKDSQLLVDIIYACIYDCPSTTFSDHSRVERLMNLLDKLSAENNDTFSALKQHVKCASILYNHYSINRSFRTFRQSSEDQKITSQEIISELIRFGFARNFTERQCTQLWEDLCELHSSWPAFAQTAKKVELYEEFIRLSLRCGHAQYCAQRALSDNILSVAQTSSLMFEVVEDMLRLVESMHNADPEHYSDSREYNTLLETITSLFNTYDDRIAKHLAHAPEQQDMWTHEKRLFRAYLLMSENFDNFATLGEIRSQGVGMELIHQLLSMNPVSVDQFPLLFEIASELGLGSKRHRDQILLHIGDKALTESDIDSALSVCSTMMNDSFGEGWKICARVARMASNISTAQREQLLSFAVQHCPSEQKITSLIEQYNALQQEETVGKQQDTQFTPILTSFYNHAPASAGLKTTCTFEPLGAFPSSNYDARIKAAHHNRDVALYFSLLQQYKEHLDRHKKSLLPVRQILDQLIQETAPRGTDASLRILQLGSYFFALCLDDTQLPAEHTTAGEIQQYVNQVHNQWASKSIDSPQSEWLLTLTQYLEQMKMLSHARQVELQASELSSSLDVRRFLHEDAYRVECVQDFACASDDSGEKLFQSALDLAARNNLPQDSLLAAYLRAQFVPQNDSTLEQIQRRISNVFSDDLWRENAQMLHDEIQSVMDDVIPGEQLVLFEYALSLLIHIEALAPSTKHGTRSKELLAVVKTLLSLNVPLDFRSLFLLTTEEQILDSIRPFVTVQNAAKFAELAKRLPHGDVSENTIHTMLFEKLMMQHSEDTPEALFNLCDLLNRMPLEQLANDCVTAILDHSKMHLQTKELLLETILTRLEVQQAAETLAHRVRIHLFNARVIHQLMQDVELRQYHDLWSDLVHNDSSQVEAAFLDMIHSAGGVRLSTFGKGLHIVSSTFDELLHNKMPETVMHHQKKIAETDLEALVNTIMEVLLAYIDDLDTSTLKSWSPEYEDADSNHPVPLIISAQWPPATEEIGSHLKCLMHSLRESELQSLEQNVHKQLREFASSKESSVEARLFVLNVLNQYVSVKQTLELESNIPTDEVHDEPRGKTTESTPENIGATTEERLLMHKIKTQQFLEEIFANKEADSSLGSLTPLSDEWQPEFSALLSTISTPQQYASLNKIITEWSSNNEYQSALYETVKRVVDHLLGDKKTNPLAVDTIERHTSMLLVEDFNHYYAQLSKGNQTLLACRVAMLSNDKTLQEECIKVLDNSRNVKRFLRESKNDETYGDLLSLCAQKGYASAIVQNTEVCKQLLQRRINMHTESEADFVSSVCCDSASSQDMILLAFAAEYVSKCVFNVPRSMNTLSHALRLMREYVTQMSGDDSNCMRTKALEFLNAIL